MPQGQLDRDARAHAVAVEVGVPDLEPSQQRGLVVRHLCVGERAFDVGSAAVRLLLGRDHLAGLGEGGQDFPELVSIVDIAPCSRTSGLPVPWTSW
jgi:hypothetical protein